MNWQKIPSPQHSVVRSLSQKAGLVTALIGSITLIGWVLQNEFMTSIFPGLPPMRVNSALGFICCGFSLWFWHQSQIPNTSYAKVKRSLFYALLIVVIGISLITLLQVLFNINLGIDELLLKNITWYISAKYSGRITMSMAFNFITVSVALILLDLGIYNLSQGLAFSSCLMALLGLSGYIYQVEYFYSLFSGGSAALTGIIAFCILSLGILFAYPEQGWIKVITSPYSGGITARRLLPIVIVLPLILGGSTIITQRNNLLDVEVSIILRSTINILILSVVTWWNAKFLNKLDLKQRQTEIALRQSHEQLENRVAERTAELTNANHSLQESYQLLQSVIEGISDPVFVKDLSGRYVIVNSAMSQKLDKPIAEILGFHDDDLFAPKIAQQFKETDHQIMERGNTKVIEEEILQNNHHKIYLSTKSPWRDREGKVIGLIGVIKDITDRKQTEAALKYREWLARFFVKHTSIPAAVFDREMCYLMVSQRWIKDYRLEEQDIIGRSHYEIFPEIPQRWKEIHQRCLAGAVEVCEEDEFIRADGTIDWLRWEVRPWYEQTGAIGGIMMFTEVITAHKEAEIALKQSEQRYANLASVIPVGIYCSNTDGYVHYVNPRWCELAGLSAEQAVGKGWEKAIHPEDRDRILNAWHEATEKQNIFCTEYRYQRPDGSISWVYGQAITERASNGDVIGYIGTVTDITERKRVEESLRENEARLRLALQATKSGIWDWDLATNRASVSEEYNLLLGRDPVAEIISYQEWLDSIHPDDCILVIEALSHAIAQYQDYEIEYRILHPEGVRWVASRAKVFYNSAGKAVRMLGNIQDITDRKQAQINLQTSEEQLRLTLEFAQIGCWAWHIQENRVTWNSKLFVLFGLDPQTAEASHQAWREHIHPDDLEQVEAAVHQALLSHTDYESEYRVVHPDGSIHWILGKGRGVYNQSGEPVKMLGVVIDITERQAALCERKQAEAALQASEEQLRLTLEFSQIGTWDWQILNNRIIWNNNHFQLLGLEPKTTLVDYETWRDRVHPDDLERVEATIRQALLHHIDYDTEYRVIYPDGAIHWRMAKGRAIYDRSGQPVRMLGVIIDITERKRAETDLQKYKDIFQFAEHGLAVSKGLSIEMVNPAFARMHGYSVAEMIGKPILSLFPSHFWKETICFMQELNEIGHLTHESHHLRKDGTIFPVFLDMTMVKDQEGNPLYRIVTLLDITERKQTEIALEESEERLRLALQAANQGLYDLNVQTGNTIVSAEYARMLGYEPEEFQETNAKFLQRLHPEERETVYQILADYIAGKRDEYRVEFRQKTKTGDWKWILSIGKVVEWDEFGNPLRMIGTHSDISERKQAEADLLASEKQLRSILENMPVMLDAVDDGGNIIVWNQECERVTGYSATEIIGNSQAWEKVYPDPIYRQEMIDRWMKIGHNYRNWEWNLTGKSGEIRTISWSNISEFFPVPGWKGWGIGVDITERKKAELEVTQLNQTLEQRVKERTAELTAVNKELEAFSYSVSHDLRAPLRGIDGFSKVLLERYSNQLDDQAKHYLDRIRAGTQRMGELIDDMLMLSRVTRAEIKRNTVNLHQIAQEISNNLSESQPERSVQWNIAPEIMALGDPALLRIVLENLLSNAWKFTSKCTEAQIEFGTTISSDKTPAYFVKDNGVGFDMAYVNKLFIAFQRLHSLNEFPGTGVGLAIVQRIIHRHGGNVWAEGTIDQGAIFYFTLEKAK